MNEDLPAIKRYKEEGSKHGNRGKCKHATDTPFIWFTITGRFIYCVRCIVELIRKNGPVSGRFPNWTLHPMHRYTGPDPFLNPLNLSIQIHKDFFAVYDTAPSKMDDVFHARWTDLALCSTPTDAFPTEPNPYAELNDYDFSIEVCRVIERIIYDKRFYWFGLLLDIAAGGATLPDIQTARGLTRTSNKIAELGGFIFDMFEEQAKNDSVLKWMVSYLTCYIGQIQRAFLPFLKNLPKKLEIKDVLADPIAKRFPFLSSITEESPIYESGLMPIWCDARNNHRRFLLLCCARKYCPQSPFHEDALPLDMFKVISAFAHLFFFPDSTKGEPFLQRWQ